MKKSILIIIGLLVTFVMNAQVKNTDANVVGHVQCNGEHVPFINIVVKGTTIGTATDGTGHYQLINLPEGNLTLRVSGIGYKGTSKDIVTETGKTQEINFNIDEDVLNIEAVVVTADRNQTTRAEAPVVVTTINPKLMQNTQSVNIAEGLVFTPGIRTETNCQNCGFTQLRMNGMDGPYTQILINSRPVFSGLAGVYGLELIPTSMVERIEVVRGGGSALFGGNAIAGTVNVITKEPKRNSYSFDSKIGNIGLGMKNSAVDGQLNMNTSVITDDRKSGGYIYASLRNRDAYDANSDDFSEMVELKNTTWGFNIFHKPGKKSKFSLDGYRIDEFRRGGNKFDYLPHESDITEQLDHLITGGNLSYDLFTNRNYDKFKIYVSGQHVKRDSYYGAQHDPNAYGNTKNFTSSIGSQYNFHSDMFLFAPSSIVVGIDNTNDYLNDMKLGANGDDNTTITKQYVNTLGAFVQSDWKSEKFNVSMGFRYDYYWIKDKENDLETLDNGVFVPRIGIMYKLTPDFRFRVGYARGYRAPQVFNEDLHVDLINAKRVLIVNSDDLDQEKSNAFTASINSVINIGDTYNDFLIEGFYTKLKDPFANEYYEIDNIGNFAYKRVNAEDGAYVAGVNFEWKSFISKKMETQLGYTLQASKYESFHFWGDKEESVSKNFMRTPNQYGYATFLWNPNRKFNTSFSFKYTGSMYAPHFGLDPGNYKDKEKGKVLEAIEKGYIIQGERLERTADFLVADILLLYKVDLTNETKMQIYMGITNVFNSFQKDYDSGIYRDAGYIYGPSQPRTINLGIKIGNIF